MSPTPLKDLLHAQKSQAAKRALKALQPGKSLALGTGSTSEIFIRELSQWPHADTLTLSATSKASESLASSLGLKIKPLEQISDLDYCIDGADFVDPHQQILKGFGGALTREKIAAKLAGELWIMIDETKFVPSLPLSRVPCEILPCALKLVERFLKAHQFTYTLRLHAQEKKMFLTDNGGLILDLDASSWSHSPQALGELLKAQCGILEHGLFLNFPVRLFSGQ